MIQSIALTDFRNLAAVNLSTPGAGLVVLTGDNGAGKTNLLEALSLLAPGRGLRRAGFADMARQEGPGGFTVAADIAAPGGEARIGTGIQPDQPGRRIVRINGAQQSANSLAEWISVLWLTPAMDRLFVEAASGRRRFLDRLVLARDPGHATHAARYEAAMRSRNRLLAADTLPDPQWLSALEAQMAEHGAALDQSRADLVLTLGHRLRLSPDGPFARPELALSGDRWDAGTLAAALARGRGRDAAAGRSLAGPHRSDLIVHHSGKDRAAAYCSTGEQKAMLLAIVLGHAEMIAAGQPDLPRLLLLDEVAAHLDERRRTALLQRLAANGAQVWMTGTDRSLFAADGVEAQHYFVAGGEIRMA